MIKSNHRTRAIAALGVTTLALGLAACGDSDDGGEGGIADTYTVASDTSFVPFEFEEDGEYVGFDIDIINAIADEVGFEVDLATTNFDGIIPGLQTGTFDIAIAGITITEDRAQTVDFTNPYYKSGLRIGVAADNTEIQGVEDLEGKRVASRLGSTSAAYIEENIEGATANTYEQLDQMYLSVEGGGSDAVLYDAPNVEYYILTTGEDSLKVVGDLLEAQDYGIAVAQGNDELLAAMNEALAGMIEDGTYAEIFEKWFGSEPEWLDELAESAS
ncbi:glutamine transport system substrate-binding protein [Georgenia satyanarayanai]|uniref:Glutamine transport system substrate-binding protein n=1 Tax=Georgenia satyanarayanai TaxID=860221 RepID=A0A2Y9AW46_9MICO|nr:transporter substrate-binding domain-containing protein [Georgenia satyanarayanai]PYF97273.1 glutamine transport system substrate-binding protein [Georgenia satyanarayanai]SSA46359.1 glutamine transport system substrate-binding protein [Georgenia satyanarayanai]